MTGSGDDHLDALRQEIAALRAENAALQSSEQASRAKSEFLAHISHELRTPLNAIIGMTELALDTPLDDKQHRFLETVRLNSEALLHLISDILDFSKIEAGQMELETLPIVIGELVEDIVEALAVPAARKGLRVYVDVHDAVPPVVVGDPSRVRQVLTNLLGNAIKYTKQGHVSVDVVADDRGVRLDIADSGVGIAIADQERVFSRFVRVPSGDIDRTSGTGLGLSITRSLVTLMGGHITMESALGEGSTFRVWLPLPAAPDGAPPDVAWSQGLHVLVGDMDDRSRPIMVRHMRRHGNDVQEAPTGPKLLSALMQGRVPEVVLLDASMRRPDPESLVDVARSDPSFRRVRFILLADPTRRSEPSDSQFDAVLHRPVRLTALAGVLAGDHVRRADIDADDGTPIEHAVRYTPPPTPPRRRAPSTTATPKGLGIALRRRANVLLVEDSADNQLLVLEAIRGAGHRVVVADDGQRGIEAARAEVFDLILMDVSMPVVDGIEATANIRSDEVLLRRRRVPVVAQTAHATENVRRRCFRAGMDDFVSKPLNRERLLGILEKWVRLTPRVLVVDDDPDSRHLLQEILLAGDADVVVATDGRGASAQAGRTDVDVALVDLTLPDMDGFAVLRALDALARSELLPVIAVTGHVDDATVARCLEAGFAEHVGKPVRRANVLDAVQRALTLRVADDAPALPSPPTPRVSKRAVDPDIADLVPEFLANRRADVRRIRSHLRAGRLDDIRRIGHSMKGTGTPYGFPELTRLGGALERAAAVGDTPSLRALTDEVEAIVEDS
ncbi:MAG: CheY-like chemotaxis protein [Myxococcota bacterium]|jgi:CheY-like chemotaxis protein